MFERILYIWAIRHPGSGYVQGINDLVTPFFVVFLSEFIPQDVEYLQFSFRWMNNLLMREIPLRATIRLWDTYLSEADGFSQFHSYVCAAFLRTWSRQLQSERDFQGIMILLQNLPTQSWGDREICELTADAFSLMSVFNGAPRHLSSQSES
uniref:Rab-GAP TBC domain-containing protein n=1 Tax=Heterorhabditis bacteriophora TaxID=37862 RepID=A0A1I7WMR8_HETBA